MPTERHVHQWSVWISGERRKWRGRVYRRDFRLCINGWCPMGQYRNGRVAMLRPGRKVRDAH